MPRNKNPDSGSASATGSASASFTEGQSIRDKDVEASQNLRRPPLNHYKSDDSHNTSSDTLHNQHHHHHHRTKPKHHVARMHGRVPSSKAIHKHPAASGTAAARPPHRRNPSEPDFAQVAQAQLQALTSGQRASTTVVFNNNNSSGAGASGSSSAHRRTTSDGRLARQGSTVNLTKSASHSSLKRNKSHVEFSKRNKSSDKLKRTASGTGINLPTSKHKSTKSQVHFDLGDDPEDEWVDASESNSPYLSRKGSIVSSGGHSSRQGESASNSRPPTPSESKTAASASESHSQDSQSQPRPESPPHMSTPERERVNHKQYLTSRLLQRTPSHGAPPQMTTGAPPQMTTEAAEVGPARMSPASTDRGTPMLAGSSSEGVTSRFVEGPGSGLTHTGSFLQNARNPGQDGEASIRSSRSAAYLSRSTEESRKPATPTIRHTEESALVPRPSPRRSKAPGAETSRTQQKLNLQRASSVIEPGQAGAGGVGVAAGMNPLIVTAGPGYDGGQRTDPRLGKLMEKTGMEYLVVRRYQNPIARSLNRLNKANGAQGSKHIPRPNTATSAGGSNGPKRPGDLVLRQHSRNVSMPDPRRPMTPVSGRKADTGSMRGLGVNGNSARPSMEAADEASLSQHAQSRERLSGSSLVGDQSDDGTTNSTTGLLRNLWEKSMDLSTSH